MICDITHLNSRHAFFSPEGMRYKRRGVDADGHVANYVETEQLIHVHSHTLSFVQTRGSVPVFWSQAGYRYNPRPRIEKGQENSYLSLRPKEGEGGGVLTLFVSLCVFVILISCSSDS